MKILLFGEYSGFFNCLKDGFLALGHDVFMASNGNDGRDYPSDFRWDAHTKNKLGKFKSFFSAANIWTHINLFKGYDVVLLIAPNNIHARMQWLNNPIYKYILSHNEKVYLSGAGISGLLFDFWYDSDRKYHQYMEGYFYNNENPIYYHNKKLISWEEYLMNHIDGYIPIWYEYSEPFKRFESYKKIIRIPINVNQFEYKPNVVRNNKIVFMHGMTSRESKGTRRFIQPAFEKMQKHYGDKAEFHCVGGLPFKEYMSLVDRTNVIVDDACSYSIAMNGLFSLLKGKVIMGGAEPVANKEYGYAYNPVINICPDIDQICDEMIKIINHKDMIEELCKKGPDFVKEYHNYIDIASEYIKLFNE